MMGYDGGTRGAHIAEGGLRGLGQLWVVVYGFWRRQGSVAPGGTMMLGASLALVVVLGQVPAVDPAALVARLGSSRYAEREDAAGALERLGRPALAALRAARDDRDPEIRSRASALLNRIESGLLTQPTLVTLDFDDQPLPEVVKALSAQTGIKLGLVPENSPSWPGRRVTLREAAPLPFWKAMDRLCDVARLQFNFGTHGFPGGNREQVFPLLDGGPQPAVPTSDSGPFRVSLLSLHYQRDVAFSRPGVVVPNRLVLPPAPRRGGAVAPTQKADPPAVNEQFYAQIQVAAEPRLSLSQNGPLKVLAVLDDRGQSLQLEPDGAGVTQRASGYFGMASGATLQLHIPLRHPETPGQEIRTLRGVLPIMVATRKPDPLVVSLQGAQGKSFRNDDVELSVLEIRANPATNQTSIDIMVRSIGGAASAAAGPAPAAAGGAEILIHRPDLHQQQIDVVDSQGRVLAWFHSSFDAEGSRMTLSLTSPDHAPPAEIRYYGLARAATEVPFEFGGVPMP
jgi:hypothetical protein